MTYVPMWLSYTCTYMFPNDVSQVNWMASSSSSSVQLFQTPTQPHQPRSFKFPQRLFGKTVVAKVVFSGQHYFGIIANCSETITGSTCNNSKQWRTLSAMRRVKNYIHATMNQERLHFLMVLHVYTSLKLMLKLTVLTWLRLLTHL